MIKYATGIKVPVRNDLQRRYSKYLHLYVQSYQAGCVNLGRAWLDKSTREVFLRDIATAAIAWWEAQGTCTGSGSLSLTGLRGLVWWNITQWRQNWEGFQVMWCLLMASRAHATPCRRWHLSQYQFFKMNISLHTNSEINFFLGVLLNQNLFYLSWLIMETWVRDFVYFPGASWGLQFGRWIVCDFGWLLPF